MQIFLLAILFIFTGVFSSFIFLKTSEIKATQFIKLGAIVVFGSVSLGVRLAFEWIILGDANTIDIVASSLVSTFFSAVCYIIYSITFTVFAPIAMAYLYKLVRILFKKTSNLKLPCHLGGLLSTAACVAYLIGMSHIAINEYQFKREAQAEADALVAQAQAQLELDAETEETVDVYVQLMELVAYQEEADANLQLQAEDVNNTAENPYVAVNPYSNSPLTGIIIFTTDEDCYVSVEIDDGLDEQSGDSFTFSEVTTQHIVPVYGLYADTNNKVNYTVYDTNDAVVYSGTAEMQTEALDGKYDDLIITANTMIDGEYTEGVNFVYSNDKTYTEQLAFDQYGEIRWITSEIGYGQSNEIDDGMIYLQTENSAFVVAMDKLGKYHAIYAAEYGVHHDIEIMENGNLLLTASNSGESSEDFFVEIDCETGEIVNSLDLREVFSRNRIAYSIFNTEGTRDGLDWCHNNSIQYVAEDQSIIISNNYQSMIAKISWPDGEIEWILGDTYEWMTYYEQFLLEPIGDDFEYMYNQHAAYMLPDIDNDPNTIDITVFDNGYSRGMVSEAYYGIEFEDDLYSRVVHYRIYQDTMEVEQIYEYGKERGTELYSQMRGDANYLETTGNYLGLFDRWQPSTLASGGITTYPVLVETNADGSVVWEAEMFAKTSTGAVNSYQCDRLSLYFDTDTYQDIYTSCAVLCNN